MIAECLYNILLGIFFAIILPFAIIYDIGWVIYKIISWLYHSHKAEIEKDVIKD